ncbi:hypothetical protein [Leptospira ryugenii]|nr:hypothetical protein [Leptospira ryugenii]
MIKKHNLIITALIFLNVNIYAKEIINIEVDLSAIDIPNESLIENIFLSKISENISEQYKNLDVFPNFQKQKTPGIFIKFLFKKIERIKKNSLSGFLLQIFTLGAYRTFEGKEISETTSIQLSIMFFRDSALIKEESISINENISVPWENLAHFDIPGTKNYFRYNNLIRKESYKLYTFEYLTEISEKTVTLLNEI